jgi:HAD superfamily hydrolase (TIGR01509 family)
MPAGALLFDFHDTLVHVPRPVADEQWHELPARQLEPLLRTWGAAVDGRWFARQLLTRTRQANDAAATSHVSPDFAAIIRHVARDAGLHPGEDQVQALWQAWYVGGHLVGEEPYPDARATLTWAKQAGYRLGLVTNRWFGRALLEPELRAHGLAGLFDAVVVSCDVGYDKPHPAIFHLALDALGLPAAQAIMVGDNLGTDIAGARSSGLRAVWKRNHQPHPRLEPASAPDAVIDDLHELRTLPLLVHEI